MNWTVRDGTRVTVASAVLVGLMTAACMLPPRRASDWSPPPRASIKYILANRAKYADDNFSVRGLSPELLAPFAAERAAFRDRRTLTVNYHCRIGSDELTVRARNFHVGHGFVQVDSEYYANNLALGADFRTSFLGLVELRDQTMTYDRTFANGIDRLERIEKSPRGIFKSIFNASADAHHEMIGYWQREDTLSDLRYVLLSFDIKPSSPASRISPDLTGNAIPVEVSIKNENGVIVSRRALYYLDDYGVSILVRAQTRSVDRACVVKGVVFEDAKADPKVRSAVTQL